MNQHKEEVDVGIPLDDLEPNETGSEGDPSQEAEDALSEDVPEDDNAGLPSLFDDDELADVGLKTASFDDDELAEDGLKTASSGNDELAEDGIKAPPVDEDAELPKTPEESGDKDDIGVLPENEEPPAAQNSEGDELDTAEDISEDDDIASESLPSEEMANTEDALEIPESASIDLLHRLETMQAQMGQLQDEFAGKIKYDQHKDEIIDKLHNELQEYKQDIVKKHILTIILDFVKIADDIRKWISYFTSLDVPQRDPVKLFRYLEAIPSDLEDIFYWQGVIPFSNREGAFDPAKQRAMKKITTGDISKDKTIAKSLRPGYEWEGKVIRQEMVAVYVYKDEKETVDTGNIDE